MTSTEVQFPIEARVTLHGLVNAPDLNGKAGVVKSSVTDGRQHVYVEEIAKSVALKLENLKFESRSVESLSAKELKIILKYKNLQDSELAGVEKSELRSKLSGISQDSEEIGEWLAKAKAAGTKPATTTTAYSPKVNVSQTSQAADQLANMSPEQLRQQARMMRSMDPASIRRMNPQLAHMTDQQIKMAADQMEMMANNPQMVKMASEKMKNMSPEEHQQMQNMAANGMPASSSSSVSSSTRPTTTANLPPTANQAEQAAQMMANMTPEQLKQQAEMLKSMDPDTIRSMNPQMANMSDEQIKMAAAQFEMMASNPDMVKMAMDQMKNMTPDQVEAMKNGTAPPPDMSQMGGDPAKMLANMDKKQLKQMLKSLKENPEMLKQFTGMSGMSEEQLSKGIDMFANMEDNKLDTALAVMAKAQKAKEMWTQANAKTGGHLMKILLVLGILLAILFVNWLFFSGGKIVPTPVNTAKMTDIPNIGTTVKTAVDQDEFDTEF